MSSILIINIFLQLHNCTAVQTNDKLALSSKITESQNEGWKWPLKGHQSNPPTE